MRVLLAGCIWVVLVGGLALYMHGERAPEPTSVVATQSARGAFALELTASFSAEPDPFALVLDDGPPPAAARVRCNGTDVLRVTGRLAPGQPLRVQPVPGLVVGANEFYVEAYPSLDRAGQAHAVRVRLLRDDQTIAEHTLWSDPGLPVCATFRIDIPRAPVHRQEHADGH